MNSHPLPIAIFVAFLCLAILLLVLSRRTQKETGLPRGRLHYSDTGVWRRVEKPYFDPAWQLVGKPDYVIETQGVEIPVEVKSFAVERPYEGQILQLAAYCHLVEVASGKRPPVGLIRYRNRTFEIAYTSELENRLHALIEEIRSEDPWQEIPRSHTSGARCAGCGFSSQCAERLDST